MNPGDLKRVLRDEFDAVRGHINEKFSALDERVTSLELAGQRPEYAPRGGKSAGERFVESEAYRRMAASNDVHCPPVEVGSFKALTSEPAGGGALIQPQRLPGVMAPPQRPFLLRNLLSVQTAASNAIEYVEETGFVNNAAVVEEGQLKPESELTFEVKTAPVRTIAHTITATRQVLQDAGQLRGIIDSRLVYGVRLAEEMQMLYGDGTSPNLQGILTHPGVQTHNIADGPSGDTKIDAIRRAMTKARVAEYPVSGLVIHPQDFEDIELIKDSSGRYVYIEAPSAGGAGTFWRLPVVESTAIEPGVALVGAFALGAAVWDRQTASVAVSEHHEDYFKRNLVLVRGESRIALTIHRPEAFVKVEFNPPA